MNGQACAGLGPCLSGTACICEHLTHALLLVDEEKHVALLMSSIKKL